jgi:hypothetical protein
VVAAGNTDAADIFCPRVDADFGRLLARNSCGTLDAEGGWFPFNWTTKNPNADSGGMPLSSWPWLNTFLESIKIIQMMVAKDVEGATDHTCSSATNISLISVTNCTCVDLAPTTPTGDTGPNKKRWDNHKTSRKRFGNTSKPVAVRTEKFHGGKDELDGNHFDCTGYGQSDRFVKTVQKIADYVNQEYKNAGVTRTEIITQTETVIPTPARPVGRVTRDATGLETVHPPDVMDISDYQNQKKLSDYQIQNQTENRQKVFSLVWQQCTESMHAKIKAHRDYQAIEQALNGIELLRIIKLISFNIDRTTVSS